MNMRIIIFINNNNNNNSIVVIISMLFVGFIGFYQRSETQNKRSLFPFSLFSHSSLVLHFLRHSEA